MVRKIKAVQFGCGPIGCSVVRYVIGKQDIELVGAIDVDNSLIGNDLGEVAGINDRLGIKISPDAEATLYQARPDIVFLTTSSSLKIVYPQIKQCSVTGANVVSTCEELAYPYREAPQLTVEIDKVAKENNITVLSTGVNPGFIMDAWPLFMTGVCQEVKHVKAVRVQDAASRRGPFQKKIGAGCTLDEFRKLVATGTLKHVGLPESIAMIADGLGWRLDKITESIEPVVAKSQVRTSFVTVKPGRAAGVRQVGKGMSAGKELIILEFEASVGSHKSYDAVYITGSPNLEVVIKGGTHGDIATAGIVVNSVHRIIDAPPGLLTVKDLPIVSPRGLSH